MSTILLAILVGAAFGFALDRVGATNPGYIICMLNLTDLHLMKTILTGIGVASIFLFGGLLLGLVDPGHLSVKTAYYGVFVGGLLLGIGFAVAGYCPGTGLTAMATGRIDAVFFVLGGLIGAGVYMLAFGGLAGSALLEPIAGGKATLAPVAGTDYPSLLSSISGEWLGLAIGMAFVIVAWLLPKRVGSGRTMSAAAE
ncbi:YeeE/YedE thiosulfate transporter family protein [Methyloceanibacter sp. wino2]|uniref:YeeE/YedE thiosulfate transporter family protein n=1 Tax=Methyloceanibacter sp. wino2 TaxID=2170729 RepID=UPI000D3E9FC0|nr:YeeE/YedE thiosulfate transporter family protein [Methyloceanibacter sp. wino2]